MSTLPELTVVDGKIHCPLLGRSLEATPEEIVRQEFIAHLHTTYGYAYEQMAQEQRIQSGRRSARVDIAVWASREEAARQPRPAPVLVVECKAESVTIHPRDYYQGESYARAVGEPCEYLVMHNRRQTAFFRLVRGLPGELVPQARLPHADDWGDAKRLERVRRETRAFSRKEFQALLSKCHNILRDVHKMNPQTAFSAISKVLFVKMYVERTGAHGTFTTGFLDQRAKGRLPTDPDTHEALFDATKAHYAADRLFGRGEKLNISEATFRRLVKELEPFNLSATGDDVKGLAFEQFLGTTFRGELGQYFTPRPVVDFAVALVNPRVSETVCDPAAGSGGFLIRAFEHVRAQIEADVQRRKDEVQAEIEALGLPEDDEAARIEHAFAELNRDLDPDVEGSLVRALSYEHIFGTDAEPDAARTAKMNMIMHGDGHGGIHYHDGLLDVNGIFEGRFDVVLTNPPFGATVGEDQTVDSSEQTTVADSRAHRQRYGAPWVESYQRLDQARGTPILNLYEIGKDKPGRPSELLFVERSLRLLRPGGRLGIVLPDGNLNTPSLGWLRRWAESKARLLAVVSLPEETFRDASVKASLVFLQRYTAEEEDAWAGAWRSAHAAVDGGFAAERDGLVGAVSARILSGDDPAFGDVLAELEEAGAGRSPLTWRLKPPPPYPDGVLVSEITGGGWPTLRKGAATDDLRARVRDVREMYARGWSPAHEAAAKALRRDLLRALRGVDARHSAALWGHVREALDYPVFTAAPARVGVTSTGSDGPNDLPEVLQEYRAFRAWVDAGAVAADEPVFA